MLARTVKLKLKCDNFHDATKQLLLWIFLEKRQFSSSGTKFYYEEDFAGENERPRKYQFEQRFNRRYDNNRFGGRNRDNFQYGYQRFSNDFLTEDPGIDWSSEDLKTFRKDFYKPHPDVLNRSENEIEEFRARHEIKVFGQNCPAPIFNFHELGLPEKVSEYLGTLNYEEPTPIQSQTWPIALSGRDMVGISRTGSGKTLAYILPAVMHIQNQPPLEQNEGPVALVLAPTRELVQQIQSVANPIVQACGMRTAALFGGSGKLAQMDTISSRREVYFATPGRLLDFLGDGVTNLKRCTYLVLDEADQMLNMGFKPQITSIINRIRPDRQVLMWSATWPKDIRNLANSFLNNYVKILVGSTELTANPNIIQVIHVCEEDEKLSLLADLLKKIREEPEHKTLIFAQTKYNVERVNRYLFSLGIRARTLHGDHSQNLRNRIMDGFRNGHTQILIATNVAGRGIDIDDIKYVINFDFPSNVEEYVHKIGRTARFGNSGTSHTLFTRRDAALAVDLINVLESSNQIISPELKELAFGARRYPVRKFR